MNKEQLIVEVQRRIYWTDSNFKRMGSKRRDLGGLIFIDLRDREA